MITTKRTKNNIADLIAKVKCTNEEIIQNILDCYEEQEILADFELFAKSDIEQISKNIKCFKSAELNKLVPDIHKGYVLSIIKNQFKNDEQAYIDTIPLFFKFFTKQDKLICNENFVSSDKRERRKLNKRRKHLIIYSMQLLKLVGLNRSSIITNDCLKHYKEEMARTDAFLEQYRLVNADGKITKLTSNEVKQKQRLAQILNISNCMDLMAKDRGFTFSLITLTLPPAYHCNPMNGTSPFAGYTPQQALDQLNSFWQSIRAHLSKEKLKFQRDLFGIQVLELQKSSTLHLHCLLYSNENNMTKIHNVIQKVKFLHNAKYDIENKDSRLTAEQVEFNRRHHIKSFDVKINDGREGNSGAKYVFKYITKTHSDYNDGKEDDSAIKNMACRHFYGCRGFNFFGINGSITKFNFILKHYLAFKDKLPKEICASFKHASFYDFVSKYKEYFTNEYYGCGKERRLLGVVFHKSKYECASAGRVPTVLDNEVILLEKRVYCVFEKNYEEEFRNIDDLDEQLDLDDFANANIKRAFENVKKKQEFHDEAKTKFVQSELVELLRRDEKIVKQDSYFDLLTGKAKSKPKNLTSLSNKLQLFKTIQENPVLADYGLRENEYDIVEIPKPKLCFPPKR